SSRSGSRWDVGAARSRSGAGRPGSPMSRRGTIRRRSKNDSRPFRAHRSGSCSRPVSSEARRPVRRGAWPGRRGRAAGEAGVSDGPGHVVPFRFELSSLVERAVASLYWHLVTRPTGQALRLGIESQIGEIGSTCLSVLDFAQVAFVDYSCADETVAKLIQRFLADDRPADAYFVVRGMAEHHREPIDAVLERHGLALVAETEPGTGMLLGVVSEAERAAWSVVERLGRADSTDVA